MASAALLSDSSARARVAAWQLEDALREHLAKDYPTGQEARDAYFAVVRAEKWYLRGLVALVALSALELPQWCDAGGGLFDAVHAARRCAIPGVEQEKVLLSNVPYLPPGVGVVLELIIMLTILWKVFLEWRLQKVHFSPLGVQYVNLRLCRATVALVALEVIDCAVFACWRPGWRAAFVARTGLFLLLPGVRGMMVCFVAVVMEFLSIAVFLAGTVVFFAWICLMTFKDDTDKYNGKPANQGFDTIMNSIYTMAVSGSTDDFLAKFLPTYTLYRSSGLLWLAFLVLVHVLLLSIVLDTLVAAYTTFAEHREEHEFHEKLHGVRLAFDTLLGRSPAPQHGHGHEHGAHGHEHGEHGHEEAEDAEATGAALAQDAFVSFTEEYGRCPRNFALAPDMAREVVAAADARGVLDHHSFLNACRLMQYNLFSTRRDSCLRDCMPALWNSSAFCWFREQVACKRFDDFMNAVLMFNFGLVIVETVYDLHNWPETPLLENLELIFALVYVCEVVLKLSVFSWPMYWAEGSNRFDFVTTFLLLGSSALEILAADEEAEARAEALHGVRPHRGAVSRYMNILRLMRLFRMIKQLKRMKSVQFMCKAIIKIVCGSKNILLTLGAVVFFFTSLSVQLWGGVLYETNPALEETEWKENHWFVLNFNDFLMAFGAWFVALLCEYSPEFTQAIAEASDIPYSWTMFPLFYVVGVMIVFELVMAFTIELFVHLSRKRFEEEKRGEADVFQPLARLEERFQALGLGFHYGLLGRDALEEE